MATDEEAMMVKKSSENTEQQRGQGGRFLMGHNGGPGRPKGSRNKLAQNFIDDVYADWKQHGAEAVVAMREKCPERYCQMIAALIPQHFKVEHEHTLAGLSDEELHKRLLEAQEELKRAGITIELEAMEADLEATEVPALPEPEDGKMKHRAAKLPSRNGNAKSRKHLPPGDQE